MLPGLVILLLVIGIALYAFAPHAPVTPERVDDVAESESYLNRLVASGNPPGLSLVVKNGHIVYNNAFGFADGPGDVKTEINTGYHWWSMTKIPTAIAVMQLQEQGKFDLDDSVTDRILSENSNFGSTGDVVRKLLQIIDH